MGAKVIDIRTGKPLDAEDTVPELESALERAFDQDDRVEISRLSQLLNCLDRNNPVALAGLAVHNTFLGDYCEAKSFADAAIHYGGLTRSSVIAKLGLIYHAHDKGVYDDIGAMDFMEDVLGSFSEDEEVLEVLLRVSLEALNDETFGQRVFDRALESDPGHFRPYRKSIEALGHQLILYADRQLDSEQ